MKEKLNMGIEIDKELIESNVSNAVCAAIASALGDTDALISKAVKAVVSSYVDSEGQPCSSGSYRAIPYLKYLAERSIKESVKSEIAKMVEENKEQFSQAIRAELNKPSVRQQLATAFIDAVIGAAQQDWRMPISVSFDRHEDY
jgi:acyl-CoA reductase-like NAD-dependent aldehyde dehydrogenase